ncbi:helix-turn-helix transcriptional regulator [Dictyobacter aurantiacus]|uniref:histidine kinase n=1 Tax=Dictyobacter aurantiacus TaxID=1936993 RepID=A0A401ZFE2_9CHLR|nr:response regulator transcription factor family protein [Dictyobacter aurantiacus]GCE05582.1 hypothetical protein KDAU_29110 [Dictyobacter aurantiacus]
MMLDVTGFSDVYVTQNEERRRLARELHDGVVQSLVALVTDLEQFRAQQFFDPELSENVENWYTLARNSLLSLRQTLNGMRPVVMGNFDFIEHILAMLKSMQDAGYHVTFECNNWPHQLPVEYASNLYQVVREAIINVCKHAEASTIVVHLYGSEGCLHMHVCDDGVGMVGAFASVGSAHGWHQGLYGLRERVLMLGGRITIESMPRQGTRLNMDVPMPLSTSAALSYQAQSKQDVEEGPQDDSLTARERELIILIAQGLVVKEIARILEVSEKTVRNHISNIYHKLAVYDRAQLVIYAMKKGLVDLNSL